MIFVIEGNQVEQLSSVTTEGDKIKRKVSKSLGIPFHTVFRKTDVQLYSNNFTNSAIDPEQCLEGSFIIRPNYPRSIR